MSLHLSKQEIDKIIANYMNNTWENDVVPTLHQYISIPCKSPMFDSEWQKHGHIEKAVETICGWCDRRRVEKGGSLVGLKIEVIRLKDRTPLIFMEVAPFRKESSEKSASGLDPTDPSFKLSDEVGGGDDHGDTVLFYGHYDKQPEMTGWGDGLGPWAPVRRGDKLYGRGGADDGYAAFASLLAIEALQKYGGPLASHKRCVILIEGCEESGSGDLPHYIQFLGPKIGKPSLVVCLDSGCGNYDQLWMTTSLRGLAAGTLHVEVLKEGVHSGDASGIVPSSFRILRELLDRIEDASTGRIKLDSLYTQIPLERIEQAKVASGVLGQDLYQRFPWVGQTKPLSEDLNTLILNRTWRPFLSVTGAEGLPSLAQAGNVLRPFTKLRLSMRIPPGVAGELASSEIKRALETNPPCGAKVNFDVEKATEGWNAPALAPWLSQSLQLASQSFFGKDACYMGEGGTIPFMSMLGEAFPDAQFVITGVLGPSANAHGPNEFLHLSMAKKLTACITQILADHARI